MAKSEKEYGRIGLMMVAPTFFYALLLLAAPIAMLLIYSVLTGGNNGQVKWAFTLSNYSDVWTGPVYRAIMIRSLLVALGVTLVTVIVAYPLAYFVSFHVPAHKKSLWLFMITIPFWTSYLIRVFLWKVILGYNGVINSGLMTIGLTDEPLQWINYNIGALIVTLAHAYAPFAVLPIFVSLEKIDRSLIEAGQDLGDSRLVAFWRVTLPLSMPGVIAAVLIVFIPTIGDYVTPELIGGGKLPMIANMMEVQMLKIGNRPLGSAIAASAVVIVGVIALFFVLLNRRFIAGHGRK